MVSLEVLDPVAEANKSSVRFSSDNTTPTKAKKLEVFP